MNLLKKWFGRSLENPNSTLADPEDWLLNLSSGNSDAGIRVNESSALTYDCVYRAVNLISRACAGLPIDVFRSEGVGRERDRNHPAHFLIKRRPNRTLHSHHWRTVLFGQAQMWGNGYSFIERNLNGQPSALLLMDASVTSPDRVDGELIYRSVVDNREVILLPEQVFHLKAFGENADEGLSVIGKARNSLGLGMAAEKYSSSFFRNGARPHVVLKHPKNPSDKAVRNIKRSWNEDHQSVNKMFNVVLLREGVDIEAFSMSNEDMQLIPLIKDRVRAVSNWFGVPPHMLGDDARTSFNSLQEEKQSFLDNAVDPWLRAFEAEANAKLLTERQQRTESHVIEFNRNALVSVNMADRWNSHKIAVESGIMNRDEVRGIENMNPIPDGKGQIYTVPLNMGELGEEPEPPPPAPPAPPLEEEDDEAEMKSHLTGLMRETSRRFFRRLLGQAKRKQKTKAGIEGWLDHGLQDNAAPFLSQFDPLLRAIQHARRDAPTVDDVWSTIASGVRDNLRGCEGSLETEADRIEFLLTEQLTRFVCGDESNARA